MHTPSYPGVRGELQLDESVNIDAGALLCIARGKGGYSVQAYRFAAKRCYYHHMQAEYRGTYLALVEWYLDMQAEGVELR
jgi:hypothetical protein